MAEQSRWIDSPQTVVFEAVDAVDIRLVDGAVNIVGTEESTARLEVESVEGPPLRVDRSGDRLSINHGELTWHGLLDWLDRKDTRRSARLTLSVPRASALRLGAVSAHAVVSGLRGRAELQSVSGEATLVGLSGAVSAHTVSGCVEAQGRRGSLRFHSVSGDLTSVEDAGSALHADSVSGAVIVDLGRAPDAATDVELTTVTGEVAVRMPRPVDAEVRASSSSAVTCDFEKTSPFPWPGAHSLRRTYGNSAGRLRAGSASGPVALLLRPPSPADAEPIVLEER